MPEKVLLFFGIQGCGKSTQGELMAELGFFHYDFGSHLRSTTVQEMFPDLKAQIDSGSLIDDSLANSVFDATALKELAKSEKKSIILDGFCRKKEQILHLKKVFNRSEINVVFFVLDRPTALKRLAGRGRADDVDRDALNTRINSYFEMLPDVFYTFGELGIKLIKIDASKSVEEIFSNLKAIYG